MIEGWLPSDARPRLTAALARDFGAEVVLEEVAQDRWTAETTPVVLRNTASFAPSNCW